MKIIGLTGKAGSGKDTAADCILRCTCSADIVALADPLKDAASVMFDIPIDNFYDRELKEQIDSYWGISPREIAQKVGTECAREVFREDFWLKRCEKTMDSCDDYFVVTDIRFENEAEWIRNLGGTVWHIERPSLGEGTVRQHVSENGVAFIEGDVRIQNDSTIEALYDKIETILDK